MTRRSTCTEVTAGGILALLIHDLLREVYGRVTPVDDVAVGLTTVLMDYIGRCPPDVADGYRRFVVEALHCEETRQ